LQRALARRLKKKVCKKEIFAIVYISKNSWIVKRP
jgi:hypothetical protein